MAEIFVGVRIATLVLTGLALILSIIGLVSIIDHNNKDATSITATCITIASLFLGAWGSYKNNRLFLITFALIQIVAIVVGAFGFLVYTTLGSSLLTIILALIQAELIRRGYS